MEELDSAFNRTECELMVLTTYAKITLKFFFSKERITIKPLFVSLPLRLKFYGGVFKCYFIEKIFLKIVTA